MITLFELKLSATTITDKSCTYPDRNSCSNFLPYFNYFHDHNLQMIADNSASASSDHAALRISCDFRLMFFIKMEIGLSRRVDYSRYPRRFQDQGRLLRAASSPLGTGNPNLLLPAEIANRRVQQAFHDLAHRPRVRHGEARHELQPFPFDL